MTSQIDTTNSSTSRLVEISFTPPPLDELNFTADPFRCNNGTLWLADALRALNEHTIEADIPIGNTINYLRTVLPNNMAVEPTQAQLMLWYAKLAYRPDPESNATYMRLLEFPMHDCGMVICNKLRWEGDPDVSGVGMLLSYYLLAGFATVYVGIIAWINFKLRDKTWKVPWILSAFRESVGSFILGVIIFAASMLAAGIVRYVYFASHPEDHDSLYGLMGTIFMATYSIMPALLVQSAADGPRRQYIMLFLWFVVIALATTLEVLYRQLYSQQDWGVRRGDPTGPDWESEERERSQALETAWLYRCDPGWLRFRVEDTLTAAHALLAINAFWYLYYVVVSLVPDAVQQRLRARGSVAKWWARCKTTLRVVNGLFAFILMWTLLIVFQAYRDKVQELAGKSNEDAKWTFGQMLALATFAPVAVELLSIMVYGPEWGLVGTLSSRFQVVQTEGGREKGSMSGDEKARLPSLDGSGMRHETI